MKFGVYNNYTFKPVFSLDQVLCADLSVNENGTPVSKKGVLWSLGRLLVAKTVYGLLAQPRLLADPIRQTNLVEHAHEIIRSNLHAGNVPDAVVNEIVKPTTALCPDRVVYRCREVFNACNFVRFIFQTMASCNSAVYGALHNKYLTLYPAHAGFCVNHGFFASRIMMLTILARCGVFARRSISKGAVDYAKQKNDMWHSHNENEEQHAFSAESMVYLAFRGPAEFKSSGWKRYKDTLKQKIVNGLKIQLPFVDVDGSDAQTPNITICADEGMVEVEYLPLPFAGFSRTLWTGEMGAPADAGPVASSSCSSHEHTALPPAPRLELLSMPLSFPHAHIALCSESPVQHPSPDFGPLDPEPQQGLMATLSPPPVSDLPSSALSDPSIPPPVFETVSDVVKDAAAQESVEDDSCVDSDFDVDHGDFAVWFDDDQSPATETILSSLSPLALAVGPSVEERDQEEAYQVEDGLVEQNTPSVEREASPSAFFDWSTSPLPDTGVHIDDNSVIMNPEVSATSSATDVDKLPINFASLLSEEDAETLSRFPEEKIRRLSLLTSLLEDFSTSPEPAVETRPALKRGRGNSYLPSMDNVGGGFFERGLVRRKCLDKTPFAVRSSYSSPYGTPLFVPDEIPRRDDQTMMYGGALTSICGHSL